MSRVRTPLPAPTHDYSRERPHHAASFFSITSTRNLRGAKSRRCVSFRVNSRTTLGQRLGQFQNPPHWDAADNAKEKAGSDRADLRLRPRVPARLREGPGSSSWIGVASPDGTKH